MKTHETTRLTIAATLLLGLTCSLLMTFMLPGSSQAASNYRAQGLMMALLPFMLSMLAAYFQYKFAMKPWQKALGELVLKALNLQESSQSTQAPASGDQLSVLRESIEVAAEQFKETRLREKALLQHAVDVICVIDLKCKILSVNPASYSVWGYRPEELVGRQVTDFLVSDDVKNTMKALVGAEKSIDKIFFENRFRKKSGEIVDLLWSAHLSASDRGLFCIAHDITDRKRAEQLLRESEERVRGILESLPAGVSVVNQDGKIEFMNKTASELSGYAKEDLQNLEAELVFSFFKTAPGAAAATTPGFDCQITRKSGERFPAEASIRAISWGKATAVLVIFLDATMKHELERAKREFVAMVSHDLRTPLTTINLIFAYQLDGLGGELNADGKEFAMRGQQSCERLIKLVQDLLDLEKMRAGKFSMTVVDTPFKEVVSAAVEAVEPYAGSQGISLKVDCPEINCYCDGGRIIQVLTNLIGNAIKFSLEDSDINVTVQDNGPVLTCSVSNHGRTIPKDKLTSIFEKFEQADAKGSIERKGTGLGLAISKTIVEQHGGKIWAESSDADGTSFSFTLPKSANKTEAASEKTVPVESEPESAV